VFVTRNVGIPASESAPSIAPAGGASRGAGIVLKKKIKIEKIKKHTEY
jgi:hypothetical protein